jgi:hypothetical protein
VSDAHEPERLFNGEEQSEHPFEDIEQRGVAHLIDCTLSRITTTTLARIVRINKRSNSRPALVSDSKTIV